MSSNLMPVCFSGSYKLFNKFLLRNLFGLNMEWSYYVIHVMIIISQISCNTTINQHDQERKDLEEYALEVRRLFKSIHESNKSHVEKSEEEEENWEWASKERNVGFKGGQKREKMIEGELVSELEFEQTTPIVSRERTESAEISGMKKDGSDRKVAIPVHFSASSDLVTRADLDDEERLGSLHIPEATQRSDYGEVFNSHEHSEEFGDMTLEDRYEVLGSLGNQDRMENMNRRRSHEKHFHPYISTELSDYEIHEDWDDDTPREPHHNASAPSGNSDVDTARSYDTPALQRVGTQVNLDSETLEVSQGTPNEFGRNSKRRKGVISDNENRENSELVRHDDNVPEISPNMRMRMPELSGEESKETYSPPFYIDPKNRSQGQERECLRDQNHITEMFEECIYFQSDLYKPEQQPEPPSTDYDAHFLKYCKKAPQLRNCIKTYILSKMEHCLDEGIRETIENIEQVTTGIIKFICNKEADRLSIFIADGGIDCLYLNSAKMLLCMANNMGTYFIQSIFDLPSLNLKQSKCVGISAAQVCVNQQLETCEDQTSANIVGLLFDVANEIASCGVLTGQRRDPKLSDASSTSVLPPVIGDKLPAGSAPVETQMGSGLVHIPVNLYPQNDSKTIVESEMNGTSITPPFHVEDVPSILSQGAESTPTVEEPPNDVITSNISTHNGVAASSGAIWTLSISFLLAIRL